MVRKLELQNEELRIGHKKNGFVQDAQKQQNFKLPPLEDDCHSSTESLINIFECDDLADEQTWLYRSSKHTNDPIDLDKWLENELKQSVPSIDITGLRTNIARRLTQVKKSIEQQQVDTRTFTRPKKRATPPKVNGQAEVYDVRERSLPRYTGSPQPPMDAPYHTPERNGTPERQEGRRTPQQEGRLTPQSGLPMPRGRLDKTFGLRMGSCSPLNRTFNLDGPGRSGDGMDDDQMSSASDSSFSSSHRAALTAGEVKNLARMQEESLRFSSTPWKSSSEGRQQFQHTSCDLPSPITRSSEDFHSDHSESRSSRSSAVGDSLHSSPAGSPFGSSQALMTFPRPTDGMLGSNEALDRPIQARNLPNKQRVEAGARGLVRPRYSAASGAPRAHEAGVGGLASNIKPQCLVRPSVQSSGIAVPTSGIPRPSTGLRAPGSRIPAPRSRAPVRKTDWMDGCY
ncbi:hypothetical protein B566_EDAN005245 [Ephemera danica]|nr:hypothetical protein B566_EDAN005245 [Ephemera danica]